MKPRQRPLSASREAESGRSSVTGRSALEGGPGVALLLALVCCIPVVVQGHLSYIGDTFYFSQSPQSDKVVEGRPHTLHCNVSDTTNISFSWVKDGETLKRTHRRFMIGASLHMRRVSRFEDNGEYACIAHNMSSGFALTSLPAHLRVVWMGVGSRVMLAEPRSQSQLRKGATVVLRCKVEASSDLDYDWFRNGDALQVGDGISTRSRRLTIVQLGVRHNGMYSCRGRNQAGQTQLQNPFKLTLRGNNAPNIEVAPTIEVAREKDPAWIPCRYDGGTLIEWYHHDHGPLTNSSSYVVFPNGTLKVTSAGKETEGVYKCVGVHPSKAQTQTYAGSLMLAYLDEVQEGDWFEPGPDVEDSHVVGDGGSMGVVCLPPRGFPVPKVNWTDPLGNPLPSSGRLRVEGTELIVEEAREEDGGVYTCTAVNIAATARAELNLYITRRPKLLSGPSPRTIEEGESTQLQCAHTATSRPYTNVSWLHDGKQLPQHGQRLSMLNNGNLQIRNSSVDDAGDYACVISTAGFPAITSPPALLVVREQLKFDASLRDEMLELNSTARVACVAKGHVPPTVRWRKLGVRDGSRLPSHLEDDNGTLVFGSVTREDEGQYVCEATSSQGAINTTINITVVELPVLVKTSAGTVEAELGEGVWLHCLAKGHPPPTVRWDYNKAPGTLHSDRIQVFDNGTLHITKTLVYDEGVYGCMVGNAGGLKRVEILLIVKAGGEVVPRTVAVTLGAAGAYLLLVASLLIYCRHRRRRLKSSASPQFRGACEHMATLCQGGTAAEGNGEGGGGGGGGGGGRRRREGNGNDRQDSNPGEGPSDPNKKSKNRAAEVEGEEIDTTTPNHTSWRKTNETKSKGGAKGGGGGHLGGSLASTSYTLESSSQSNQHLAHVQIEKPPLCRDNLQVLLTLGRGEFGDVQLARMKGSQQQKKQAPQSEDEEETNSNQDSLVMIKVVSTRDEHLLAEVCREVEMYNGPGHANIVSLVGVIADSQPNVVVLHYTDWGDLKQFLLATRKDSARPTGLRPPPLNVPHAMQLMLQVARGLEYLSSRRQTHRDVAARNCLITSTLQVKLASPALSRDAYAREYFTYRNQVLPVRWLAPEALLEDDHSMKSDVFSWAWLAWEILTQALMPHAALSDTQVVDSVKQRDLKFSTPSNIPESLGTLIHSCWNCSPRNRPAISNVVSTLHSTLTATPS